MKNYIDLKSCSYRHYNPKEDYQSIVKIFIEFQEKNKIKQIYSLAEGQSPMMKILYFKAELKKLLDKCTHRYVAIDDDTGKIFGAAIAEEMIKDGEKVIILQFAFKDPKYIFNRKIKFLLAKGMITERKKHGWVKIIAVLGDREKFKKYIEFVKRMFKIKVVGIDQFKRHMVEFL